eukprot:6126082-Lingulodinium_polyedra.AAC.1
MQDGCLLRRTSTKFIDSSVRELGMVSPSAAPTPTTEELQRLEGGVLSPQEATTFRTVTRRPLR